MTSQKPNDQKKAYLKDIILMSLGWELALPIFGGALLGYFMERTISTRYYLNVGFLLLGVGVGYYNIYKHIEIEKLRLSKTKQLESPEEPSQ